MCSFMHFLMDSYLEGELELRTDVTEGLDWADHLLVRVYHIEVRVGLSVKTDHIQPIKLG